MSPRFDFNTTPLADLVVFRRKPIGDTRGFLERMFCATEMSSYLHGKPILQINRTLTARSGTVRGMHFQAAPHQEAKIVSCLRGRIFDVAVDNRPDSPTYLQWYGEVLSEDNSAAMLIPEGFAHGFQTLAGECELLYMHTAFYSPDHERGLNAMDPALAIRWPLPISAISDRDSGHPLIAVAAAELKS